MEGMYIYHPKLDFTSISSYNKSLNRDLQKRKEKKERRKSCYI